MKFFITIRLKYLLKVVSAIALIIIFSLLFYNYKDLILLSVFNSDQEATMIVQSIFDNRNKAILNGDLDLIKKMYNTNTKYGQWAYEYEVRKVRYIHNWEKKQGVEFIEIKPKVLIKRVRKYNTKYTINLQCITEYKYIYEDKPNEINVSRIGTSHILDVVSNEGKWIIKKEWYKDPFGDSIRLSNFNIEEIKKYILGQKMRDLSSIGQRRVNAIEYADKYNGASNIEGYAYRYNNKYRNFNSVGGDCANFASQVLYEGGKFRKTSSWNYSKGSGTRAWLNADGFTRYMLNSGRASLIARGKYEQVYKRSYKLLPGDVVAYESKGDIDHVSVVTGADSRGYTLVSCHNTDRDRVPWDLGWSGKSIRFWLIRVHY